MLDCTGWPMAMGAISQRMSLTFWTAVFMGGLLYLKLSLQPQCLFPRPFLTLWANIPDMVQLPGCGSPTPIGPAYIRRTG